ncbi:MAG: hypothetical protein WB780_17355 [Candidatus Acidiferrales bacterium]
MSPRVQFVRSTVRVPCRGVLKLAALFAAILLVCLSPLRAQEAPSGTVGRVEGKDISVESGAAASGGNAVNAPSIFVSNGSVVTVHSGQARLVLVAGGEIDICGPAKFTLLQSAGAITLALNFGRVHVILPLATSLRIFTPTIVATPLDISGGRRDITVGLDLTDSLCVLAASGALRLEQQFSGEILDVPQLGEFFLAGGKLMPVVGTPGSCRCDELQVRAASPSPPPPIPDAVLDARPTVAQAPPALPAPAADPEPAPQPLVSLGVLADANGAHPVAAPQKNVTPESPPVSIPEYKIVMPPLTFSANSPEPPPDPTPDMILLVRTAHVERDWQFTGHVEAPRIEEVAQRSPASGPPPQPAQKPEKKKGGFWARLKRAFTGG